MLVFSSYCVLPLSPSYNGYLAPHSPSELNIDHNLRGELVAYVNKNLPGVAASASNNSSFSGADTGLRTGSGTDLSSSADLVLGAGQQMHASQLQTMLRMYERIQAYIFRLMATDSVPKVRPAPPSPSQVSPVHSCLSFSRSFH